VSIEIAVKILVAYNEWRRGAEIEMLEPKEIGIALDKLIGYYYEHNNKSQLT